MLIEYTSSLYIVLQVSIYALYEFSRRRDAGMQKVQKSTS